MTSSRSFERAQAGGRGVTRRDFVNGVAVSVAAAGHGMTPTLAAQDDPPRAAAAPEFTGQSLATAGLFHARQAGADLPPTPLWRRGDEEVDLVVVGAGICGLAAAHLYRQHAGRGRRVLVLEAAPEIGGHALRNEFVARNGRRVIGYGGSEALDSPGLWSQAAHSLIRDIGIELKQFESYYDSGWRKRQGLSRRATYFDPRLWGQGGLFVHDTDDKHAWIEHTPMEPAARSDLLRLLTAPPDPWPAADPASKRARLARITYDVFLTDVLRLHPQLTLYFRNRTQAYLGAGTDACSALDAFALGLPGFGPMALGDTPDAAMSPSGRQAKAGQDDYIYHFPDGNAGVVRALLRALIPQALPGTGDESLVLGARDDSQLDVPGAPVRIRLGSPVTRVRHAGRPDHSAAADVGYLDRAGVPRVVRARHVVMACFHRMVPYLCPELGARQAGALNDQIRVPLVYANVLLSNWHAFAGAGIAGFDLPGHFWEGMRLDMPVSVGRYRFAERPDEPVLVRMAAVVLGAPGASPREQAVAGRRKLLSMRFDDIESDIRRILDDALGHHGFDGQRDIEALTLNRWAHGYSYEYMRPWDTYWPAGPLPCRSARRRLGRIVIANSDAGAFAYAHGAIDQATRAVAEILPQARLPWVAEMPGPPRRLLKLA